MRGVPCVAFLNGSGKLNGPGFVVAVKCGNRVGHTALSDHVACTTFTTATLRGNAEFELHFVKRHARAHMACNFAI